MAAAASGPPPRGQAEGILSVDTKPLPREAFEVEESIEERRRAPGRPNFAFLRNAKASVFCSLGIADASPEKVPSRSTLLDSYTKASDEACTLTWASAMTGVGVISLPVAFAQMGYLLGISTAFLIWLVQLFLAHQIMDTPRAIGRDVEDFDDVVFLCFERYGLSRCGLVTSVLVTWSYFCGILFVFMDWTIYSMSELPIFTGQPDAVMWAWGIAVAVPSIIVLMLLSDRTTTKDLHLCGRVVMMCDCILMVAFICCCTAVRAQGHSEHHTPKPPSLKDAINGIGKLIFTFGQLMYTPFVLSDMLKPENAKRVCNRAFGYLFAAPMLVGLSGYVAWGDLLLENRLFALVLKDLGASVAVTMRLLVFLKLLCGYPLWVAPMIRSLWKMIGPERSPQLELKLPWALRQLRRRKAYCRLLINSMPLIVVFILRWSLGHTKPGELLKVCGSYPNSMANFIMPSLVLIALWPERMSGHGSLPTQLVCIMESLVIPGVIVLLALANMVLWSYRHRIVPKPPM